MASRVQHVQDGAVEAIGRERIEQACAALELGLCGHSVTVSSDLTLALVRRRSDKLLLVISENESRLAEFSGERCDLRSVQDGAQARLCRLTLDNAQSLRKHVPFLAPVVVSGGVSLGTGDRLGLATPGHIRAVQGSRIQPVLAQQSIRELRRTGRAPRDVMDAALWGVLEAGYRGGYAGDADHLKTVSHIDSMLDAGFTMYTVDPGELLDGTTGELQIADLATRVAELPWDALECTMDEFRRRYAGRRVTIAGRQGDFRLELTPSDALRAAAKYGRAIARVVSLYRHLTSRCARESFAFEVAVDETDTPTSAGEHWLVVSELQRLGVRLDSLAPRFVGSFFKGVDYIGDLQEFRSEFRKHVLIAEDRGGYRLSLHSGSDKFSIYPMIAELAGDSIHIKTSGTSYLEALRVVAGVAPAHLREIVAFAKRRYAEDAADYRVGSDLAKVVDVDGVSDKDLPLALDQPDTRQVCHVTFGSVLTTRDRDGRLLLCDRLMSVLRGNEAVYHRRLEEHFRRHVRSFV